MSPTNTSAAASESSIMAANSHLSPHLAPIVIGLAFGFIAFFIIIGVVIDKLLMKRMPPQEEFELTELSVIECENCSFFVLSITTEKER